MKTNTKLIIACIFTMVMILHFNVQAQQARWKYQTYENPLALFPKKAFGYWDYEQNKNVFQANIEAYIAEYKKRDLPLSGIVIEPCWQKDYNGLQWNENYPNPQKMISDVDAMGVSIGLWENGWLNPNCANWSEAIEKGFLVPFTRPNWVGMLRDQSRQLDTKNTECINWWMKQHEPLLDMNVVAFKLDAGYDKDAASLILSEPFAKKAEAYTGKRILALKCWGGWARDEGEVSTGLWQGDPWPLWQACRDGVLCAILNGLSGSWFFGSEIGSYDGRNGLTCSPELYQRWCEWGMCAPQPEAMGGKNGREPWKLGADCENTFRKFAKWRMRLTPYVYSYNWNAFQTKEPLIRALAIDFPDDPNCYFNFYEADALELQRRVHSNMHPDKPQGFTPEIALEPYNERKNFKFMFGREILVAPIVWEGETSRDVYLPAGTEWIDYKDGKTIYQGGQTLKNYPAPINEMPMFVKAGSIIPMGPDMLFIDEKPLTDLTLDIYPSKENEASFELYEDDGISLEYRKGAYSVTKIGCGKLGEKKFEVNISASNGDYKGKEKHRNFSLLIHRQKAAPLSVEVNGQKVQPAKDASETWTYDAKNQLLTIVFSSPTNAELQVSVKNN